MNELPQGWIEASLGEITWPRGEKADPSSLGDIQFIGMDHIEAETARLLGTQPVSELKSAVNIFREGDILYGRLRPYLNKVHEAEFDGAASAEFIVIPPSSVVEQRYLAMTMRQPGFVNLANQRSTGDRPRVNFESVADYKFPLPPLSEQRRIVTKLDSLFTRTMTARGELARIPLLIERYKQAILEKAFSGELVQGRPYDKMESISHYVLQLDQGWSPKCEAFSRTSTQSWAVLKTTAVQPIRFVEEENKQLPSQLAPRSAIEVKAGDVLITRAGPRSRVGITCVVEKTSPRLMLADKIYRLKLRQNLANSMWVALMLNSSQSLLKIEKMKTGISDSGLNLTQEKFLSVPLPSITVTEQEEVVRVVQVAFNWIDNLASDYVSAEDLLPKLEQAILAKAFRGELVLQDPNDEPAEKLLEGIWAERGAQTKTRRGRSRVAGQ